MYLLKITNTDDKEELTLFIYVGKSTLFVDIKKDRFLGEKKSNYLIEIEKTILAKSYLKALYNLTCKLL